MAGIAAGSLFAPTADAAVIVDQQPTAGIGLLSTFFTLQPGISVAEIDSFMTTTAYRLGMLTAFSSSDGLGPTISVTGSIYSGGPPGGPGADLITTASGTLDANHNIVVDFGGVLLPAGTYYLTAFVVRQRPRHLVLEYFIHRPAGADLADRNGPGSAAETSPFTDQPLALAYTLTGALATPAPEPPTWALFGGGFALAGLLSTRRRLRPIRSRS